MAGHLSCHAARLSRESLAAGDRELAHHYALLAWLFSPPRGA